MKKQKKIGKLITTTVLCFILMGINIYSGDSTRVLNAYTRGLYQQIKHLLGKISICFSFSFGELLVGLLLVLGILIVVRGLSKHLKAIRQGYNTIKDLVCDLHSMLNVLLIGLVVFQLIWGINYYQPPLYEQLDLERQAVDGDLLFKSLTKLSQEMTVERLALEKDTRQVVTTELTVHDLLNLSYNTYRMGAKKYDFVEMPSSPPKAILTSSFFSYNGISGIYNPFTGEANVNILNSKFMLPVVGLHELTHQQGIAREDEANFLAYLIASQSDDPFVRYSGNMLVLIHGLNNLSVIDFDRYVMLYESLDQGIKLDLEAHRNHWAKYDGPLDEVQDHINDQFLKLNGQDEGIKSYSQMIELYLAWTLKNI
jgi:hypothetical protein